MGLKNKNYNLYQYVLNNSVNFVDPTGNDVWLEGAGTDPWSGKKQTWGHMKICVGDPHCYSFGTTGKFVGFSFVPEGEFYEDYVRGGKIDYSHYLHTTKCEDKMLKSLLDSFVGMTTSYNFITSDCRTWTNLMFDNIKKAGFGGGKLKCCEME